MKLAIEFTSAEDVTNFLASLTPAQTTALSTGTMPGAKMVSAAVTPEKQEAARKATGKVKDEAPKPTETPPADPEAALVAALTYERDLGPLFARAVVHNKPAALAVIGARAAHEIPKPEWPAVMSALQAVLDGPTEADTPALDYERDVVPKMKLAQAKDKAALAEILKTNGAVDAAGKVSGRFLKPEALGPVVKALDALLA